MKVWKSIQEFLQDFKAEIRKDWIPPYYGVYRLISMGFILFACWTWHNTLLCLFFLGCAVVVSGYLIWMKQKQFEQEKQKKDENKAEDQK